MKLRLPSFFLSSLLAFFSLSPAADIIADGVNEADIAASTHFFDMGKGSYAWGAECATYSIPALCAGETETLRQQTGDYSFLGELAPRVDTTLENAFDKLNNDTLLCWAFAASNQLQYWQSTYGIFYQGDKNTKPLQHGYSYDKQYHSQMAGTLSLDIGMLFYDTWTDEGGFLGKGLSWYLLGKAGGPADGSTFQDGASGTAGGYFTAFADSFMGNSVSAAVGFSNCVTMVFAQGAASSTSLAHDLGIMMGYGQNADKSFSKVVEGHIASMSVYWDVGGGHAITVYGFGTDAAGNLVSLTIADSDDARYGLQEVYVKNMGTANNAKFKLYTDAACTKAYGGGASIGEFYGISWSQELHAMRVDYDNDILIWNGGSDTWVNTPEGAESEKLPGATSGWGVKVEANAYVSAEHAGMYSSYFRNGRSVGFDDRAANAHVAVGGDVSVAGMIVATNQLSYEFSGHSITAAAVEKHGASDSTLRDTTLRVGSYARVTDDGALRLAEGATVAVGDAGNPAYTLTRRGEDGAGALRHLQMQASGLAGESAEMRAEFDAICLSIAEGRSLTMQNAIVGADSRIVGDEGAQLTVFNVTLVLDEGNVALVPIAEPQTVGMTGGPALTMSLSGQPLVLDISTLSGLCVSGENLTLDLSALSAETRAQLLAAGDVQFTFANSVSVEEITGLAVTMNGQGLAEAKPTGRGTFVFSAAEASVPEPATGALAVLGVLALAVRRRRR